MGGVSRTQRTGQPFQKQMSVCRVKCKTLQSSNVAFAALGMWWWCVVKLHCAPSCPRASTTGAPDTAGSHLLQRAKPQARVPHPSASFGSTA